MTIIKGDKKRKEQQAILDELESIKTLLDEDDGMIDDGITMLGDEEIMLGEEASIPDDIPLLQEMVIEESSDVIDDDSSEIAEGSPEIVVESSPEQPVSNLLVDHEEEEELIHDDLDIDLDMDFLDEETNTTPGVLPGQQSLFDEKKANIEKKQNELKARTEKQKTLRQSHSSPTKASGENPFLPKHIRERLNGTVDVPAYEQTSKPLQKRYESLQQIQTPKDFERTSERSLSPSTPPFIQESDRSDELIEAVVKEFLPKIEAKLRQQLKEKMKHKP
ncbi:MAG: hypothetical protein ACRBCI_01200 [Cellvibrionaceae bacterium]